jgi:hypothetical protein
LGRARSAFSAPRRNRSRHSSISATVSPCFRAAAGADIRRIGSISLNPDAIVRGFETIAAAENEATSASTASTMAS